MVSRINTFLLKNDLRIVSNPCISPDFCLDWPALKAKLGAFEPLHIWAQSGFETRHGNWLLVEDLASGDCAWRLRADAGLSNAEIVEVFEDGFAVTGNATTTGNATNARNDTFFPATWANLLRLKNHILEFDAGATIFPSAGGNLGRGTLGVGARFTTLHWPAVEWVMAELGIGLTANQNSIPRELVYDVNVMLDERLETVPFPFIGTNVPEGHQGQSVQGMSHGCVISKLKNGFHHRRIEWSFNADHQPIGGKFDLREDALVEGCLLASYITFDLSPELASGSRARIEDVDTHLVAWVRARLMAAGLEVAENEFVRLFEQVWPAMQKMKRRDEKYAAVRTAAFTTGVGRAYLRELSIDELPGLTTPETTAVMLVLCEALGMKIHFIAPAFGFQKNMPYPDNAALRALIERQWAVCNLFEVGIGFHSGSGKSAENYQVMGEVTGSRLEIKTSGRYTYEMGRALFASSDATDQALWKDWYRFTVDLAVTGVFSSDPTERKMARTFVLDALALGGNASSFLGADDHVLFASSDSVRRAIGALTPSPEHMFWFEYNFLYVLAADGRSEKTDLGNHSPAGYLQRKRFYSISEQGRLGYLKNVAVYLLFLAKNTALARAERVEAAEAKLAAVTTLQEFTRTISGR